MEYEGELTQELVTPIIVDSKIADPNNDNQSNERIFKHKKRGVQTKYA